MYTLMDVKSMIFAVFDNLFLLYVMRYNTTIGWVIHCPKACVQWIVHSVQSVCCVLCSHTRTTYARVDLYLHNDAKCFYLNPPRLSVGSYERPLLIVVAWILNNIYCVKLKQWPFCLINFKYVVPFELCTMWLHNYFVLIQWLRLRTTTSIIYIVGIILS